MTSFRIPPGVKYIILSTIFFAMMNVGVKYIKDIPAYEIVFFRSLVTLVIGYFLVRQAGLSPWGNNKKLLILRGIAGTIGLMCYFYTLQRMPLASAVTIQYMSPIFTIVLAAIMVKEPPTKAQALCFIISFAGVAMIKGFDPRVSFFDMSLGLTSALFSGFAYNYIRLLKGVDHPFVVVFYFPLVTVPTIGTYMAFNWVTPQGWDWPILILVGVATTFAQIYMTKAYQADLAANISNFNYLGSVYAILLGLVLFGEMIPLMGLLGIALIIGGVILSSRFRQPVKEAH